MTRALPFRFFIASLLALSLAAGLLSFSIKTAYAEDDATGQNTANTPPGPGGKLPPPPLLRPGTLPRIKEVQDMRGEVRERMMGSTTMPKPPKPEHMGTSSGGLINRPGMPKPFASSTGDGRPLKERFEEERHRMQERMNERQTAIRNQLARKGEEQYTKTVKRLSAAVLRLGDIADRLDSRIGKLSNGGVDVATAESLLTTARAAISDADAKVKAIPEPTFPSTTDASTTPQMINDSLKPARDAAKAAEDAIKAAQKALTAVVVEIKAKGGAKADEEAPSN